MTEPHKTQPGASLTVLVPREPTEAMIEAFNACPGDLDMVCQDYGMQAAADLKARLAAAIAAATQQATTTPQTNGEDQ